LIIIAITNIRRTNIAIRSVLQFIQSLLARTDENYLYIFIIHIRKMCQVFTFFNLKDEYYFIDPQLAFLYGVFFDAKALLCDTWDFNLYGEGDLYIKFACL